MIQHLYYLIALLVSLAGLATLDHRYKLAFFLDRIRTFRAIAAGLVFFMIWDLLGIASGIFMTGDSRYLTGVRLAPDFPVEELFFLTLLSYNALLLWRAGERLWPRT